MSSLTEGFPLASVGLDCRSCYKCIRSCPTKAISFHDGVARILPEECVLCGQCYRVCPQGAKEIRDDREKAKAILKEGNAYCSLAPSFLSAYPKASFEGMEKALLSLGFLGVEETAVGATVTKREYDRLADDPKRDVTISTCCHSVILLVERYYPDLLPLLAPIKSPMRSHGALLKKEHPGAKVIFVGPCISKKHEADRYPDDVDCVLTFPELDALLKERGIQIPEEYSFAKRGESKARLFPMEGGILKTMDCDSPSTHYLSLSGMEECMGALEAIRRGEIHHAFLEMSSCRGSCLHGPALPLGAFSPEAGALKIMDMAGEKDFAVPPMNPRETSTQFFSSSRKKKEYSEEEIASVLAKIGKTKKKDELNCSSCGYSSCREKAVAVLEGKANLTMCLPYLMDKAQSLSREVVSRSDLGILVLDESLKIEMANPAMAALLGMSQSELIGKDAGDFLDPEPFASALMGEATRKKKIQLDRYQKILLEDVSYDSKYRALICFYEDVTKKEEEKAKRQKLARESAALTDEILDKNMRTVQEIAQLLGESTAETKVALNHLKDAMKNDDD